MVSFPYLLSGLSILLRLTRGDDGRSSLWPISACTDKSLTIPSWTVKDFYVRSNGQPQAGNETDSAVVPARNATASFTLKNRVINYQMAIRCSLDNGACSVRAVNVLHVAVQVSNTTAQISVSTSWVCRDKKNLKGQTVPYEATFLPLCQFH